MHYRIDIYIGSDNHSREINEEYLGRVREWADENFLIAFEIHNDSIVCIIIGEIANPSFVPVTVNSFDYEVTLDDILIIKDNLQVGLIPGNSYFEINKIHTVSYSSMDPNDVSKILSIRTEIGKRIAFHGKLYVSSNGINGVQTVNMSIVEG